MATQKQDGLVHHRVRWVQLIESYQLDPQKVISEREQTKAKYKMDSGVRKVDAEIAEQLIPSIRPITRWCQSCTIQISADIPLFLRRELHQIVLSAGTRSVGSLRPEIAGTRDRGGVPWSTAVDASFIVKKLEDFQQVLPGYGISSD